jgi:hypothetical protein
MAGLFGRLFSRESPARRVLRTTTRSDWDALTREIFARVIHGCRFAIGVVARQDGAGGELGYRLNQEYPNPDLIGFVHKNLGPETFAAFFPARHGLRLDKRRGLLVVADERLGLPKGTIVCPVAHAFESGREALVLFGGERLEGQLEDRLVTLEAVLAGDHATGPKAAARGKADERRRAELLEALQKMDTKRLYEQDLAYLADLVNALDEIKDDLPLPLKSKYGAVTKYLLKKRLKK